ncbi:MAG: phosphoribosylaminoimidazolesuccinocarboxamide synthase, partial [Actinomycetota bacterium]|nr:phosphoribosylaminoimidazolesuccinocarboxamide synthase [Actinomycetota bacterium]
LKEYAASGRVCGIPLPQGLGEAFELPEPIFTPATKAATGHDENVPFEVLTDALGDALAHKLRELTLTLYRFGRELALDRGIILADTKFEFGLIGGDLVLVDEMLTPDSSRYWPVEDYAPGRPQPSFDKQFVRDFAASTGWEKTPPAPHLPDEIVWQTRSRYVEAYERLTGRSFEEWVARF